MAYTDQEKLALTKRLMIARLESADSFEAFKTFIGPAAWPKLIALLKQDLLAEADQQGIISQEALDKQAKILEFLADHE